MPTLTARDAERVLGIVAEAEEYAGDQPFTGELLARLVDLVQADWVGYDELDLARRRTITAVELPGSEYDIAFLWSHVAEHPVRTAHWRGHVGALKLSDFLSRRALRRSRLYDCLRLFGVEHTLEVQLPESGSRRRAFSFDRFGGPDFTERDRLVLDLLRPHLARLWREAGTRRSLRAAFAELEAGKNEAHGVIVLDAATSIEFASPAARRMLRVFFADGRRRTLPPELVDWAESKTAGPLHRRLDDRRLIVERENQTLLLREERVCPQLTAREQEVLSWVARGKTNAEIAERLWLAPSTVRKHLENVYVKLGVNTRTAAVASFLGLLEAEAS